MLTLTLYTICLSAGWVGDQFTDLGSLYGVSMLALTDDLKRIPPRPELCFDRTTPVATVLNDLFEGTGFTWEYDRDGVVVVRRLESCTPQAGAHAKLPACLPPAMRIAP
jgi:hypothetical protein